MAPSDRLGAIDGLVDQLLLITESHGFGHGTRHW